MKISYHVNSYEVRDLCIQEQYYTSGNNDEYCNMLFRLCKGHTLKDIERIAKDIYEHSNKERLADYYRDSEKPVEKVIAEYIINECTYIIVE